MSQYFSVETPQPLQLFYKGALWHPPSGQADVGAGMATKGKGRTISLPFSSDMSGMLHNLEYHVAKLALPMNRGSG